MLGIWSCRKRCCATLLHCATLPLGSAISRLPNCPHAEASPHSATPPCCRSGLLGFVVRLGLLAAGAAVAYGALNKAGVIGKKKDEPVAAGSKNGKAGKK